MQKDADRPVVSREQIAADLAQLGFRPRDVVFFHSSLRSLGWVEGGAETVIDSLLDVVGPEGLIIAPTFTATFAKGDLARCAFDPAETPSRVGRITDALWRRPNAHRSAHPTHSIAAIGRRAEELIRGHEHTSTFGKDGPYRRYVDWGAKLLFLGVDLRCNTTLHAIEDWLDLPYLQEEEALTVGPDGQPMVKTVTKAPMGDRDFYRQDSKVERLLANTGLVHRGKVAAADACWMASQEMVEAVVDGIYDAPDLLLCDREGCEFCTRYRQPTIDHIRNNRPRIYGAPPKEATRRSSQNAGDAGC